MMRRTLNTIGGLALLGGFALVVVCAGTYGAYDQRRGDR